MINNKIKYIGKRSRLLNSIKAKLPEGDLLSFDEAYKLHQQNLFKKSIVVLFSIPEKGNEEDYFKFISKIQCELIINISSTSIYASNYYKNLFLTPHYLKIKQKAHDIIMLREKSINLIVGVISKNYQFPLIPYTSKDQLIDEISRLVLNKDNYSKERFCFNIIEPKKNTIKLLPYYLRLKLKNSSLYLSLLIDLIYKVLRFKARGYTCLSNSHFVKTLRIGDGTFGVAGSSKNDIIIRSSQDNRKMSGIFLNTLIGFNKIGLDKLRHGVKTYLSNGLIKKEWKLSLRLRRLNRTVFPYHVKSISWLNERDCFLVNCFYENKNYIIFAKKIKLAAGTLENIRLLLKLTSNNLLDKIRISDHFIGSLGTISFNEAVRKGFIKNRFANIIFQRKNLVPIYKNSDIIGFVEFRIPLNSKTKLIKFFNKLQAYVFNRVGFLFFKQNTLEVKFQLLTEDSIGVKSCSDSKDELEFIDINNNLDLTRKNIINLAKNQLFNQFDSFYFQEYEYLPAHHTWGGQILLQDIKIKNLLQNKKIFICGSPSNRRLGPFHHSLECSNRIKFNKNKKYFD